MRSASSASYAVVATALLALAPRAHADAYPRQPVDDENAATHIAFGSGFGGTRVEKPARGVNRSAMHLDVMIGSPDLQVTGINASGRRIPLITDGAWQI